MDVITTHINADFDSLASMLAAKKLYPDALLAFPGSQERGLREFLLHSTIYLFEAERLKKIELKKITRLILVDIRQSSRIGKFQRIIHKPDLKIHIYDHHPPSPEDLKGSLEVVKEVGATTTILCEILKEKNIEISPDEATVMMLGIYEDTGNLTFSSTKKEDFLAAAHLLSKGANLNLVSDMISKELTAEQVFLLNELIQSATTHNFNGIEVVIAKATSDKYVGDFAVLVHKLKDMENINVLFALASMEDRIYLVARSRIPEVNVGEIALKFGGGGHSTAASATIKGATLFQVEANLIKVLQNTIKPLRLAKNIMSFPVKVIEAEESLSKAGEIMTRYNINGLPVVEKGRVLGLISRQLIEKASFHGLKDLSVKEYMTTEFSVVEPGTPLSTIQTLIIENNQRFLPVVDKGKLMGAITRTDLLRILQADLDKEPDYLYSLEKGMVSSRKKMLSRVMEEILSPRLMGLLKKIGEVAKELNYNAYVVGGFVRDLLLRKENLDMDIVVEGDGIKFTRKFLANYEGKAQYHKKFGTAQIIFPDGLKIDVATARLEYYEHPAALPRVETSTIKLDLYRRDFTINTLAIKLNLPNFGELIDFFGAQRDIKEKSIRIIHNLSFVEDPTRILRAIRFEQRLNFQIGKLTSSLIENAVKMNLLEKVPGSRLYHELVLILEEKDPFFCLKRMADFNLLKFIHPQIIFDSKIKEILTRLNEVIAWFELLFLEEKYEKWLVYFLALIDSLGKKEVEEVCQRLALPKKYSQIIIEGREGAFLLLGKLARKKSFKNSEIYYLLSPLPTEILLYLMAKTNRGSSQKAISLYFTQLKSTKPLLNGEDLIKLGFTPGKGFKQVFSHLLKARLDGKVQSKRDEINLAKKYLKLSIIPWIDIGQGV